MCAPQNKGTASGASGCVVRRTKGLRLDRMDRMDRESTCFCCELDETRGVVSRWVWAKPSEAARGRGSRTRLPDDVIDDHDTSTRPERSRPAPAFTTNDAYESRGPRPTDPAPLPSLLT